MKNVYEVLRQKELELSRLEKEVEGVAADSSLLTDAEVRNQPPTLEHPVNEAPQPDHSGWQERAKKH